MVALVDQQYQCANMMVRSEAFRRKCVIVNLILLPSSKISRYETLNGGISIFSALFFPFCAWDDVESEETAWAC